MHIRVVFQRAILSMKSCFKGFAMLIKFDFHVNFFSLFNRLVPPCHEEQFVCVSLCLKRFVAALCSQEHDIIGK